ncbi:histidine kinase dimerization/phospho-acceptor domain-containing protein [Thalassotalea fonticola]|uniref:histidine kinase n=1 Tax=Thalassotalea fonticola TaxID=3065649 RepID=A0ABZ0GR22_9GAMM|nr:histidine kinase dimerization/phospho-acceptor domain-containing protein [Colwelliaceae bacterium S1-1]
MKNYSLKTRMVLFGLMLHAAIWLLAASASSYTAAHVIFQTLDKDLQEQARFVRFSSRLFQSFYSKFDVNEGYDPLKDGSAISESIGWGNVNVVINDTKGNLIFRSSNAPGFDFPTGNGFVDDMFIQNGEETHWRIYNENIDGIFWVSVGMNTKQAKQSAIDFGLKALYPMILIIPLTIIGVYIGSKKGLAAINKIASDVAHRNPSSLVAISDINIPEEVFPLVKSLNGLLVRLASAIENEHRFTANAAHELQTPLAAIKTELQLCQRRSKTSEVQAELDRISARVDRAVYTVRQLLTLARIESEDSQLKMAVIDLHDVVAEDLADLAHLAVERQVQIDFAEHGPWQILGNKEVLSILIRNLFTNAFRYATAGGQVKISANVLTDKIEFYVANECVVMDQQQREKLTDSFYRLPGNEMPGAGLGLSIVQRIVEVHHADLAIQPWHNEQGIMVKVTFPIKQPT